MPTRLDPLSLPPVPPPAPATHPRRDLVVAILLALAVAVPLLALSVTWSRTLAVFEKRPMAKWPAPELRTTFPPAFERAFADRFGGRDALIRLHHASLLQLFGVSGLATVMPGRDGWYYWLGEDGLSLDRNYRGVVPFAQKDIDATVAELLRRRDWLAARGIPYVVAVVPEKFTIYPEYLPAWVARSEQPSPYDRVAAALQAGSRIAFVDLRPALRAAKARDRVYFKTDSHWNFNGAIVGYEAIMREVLRALPADRLPGAAPVHRPSFAPGVDYYSGDLAEMLGLPRWIREDDVAPLAKILGDTTSRCAKRVDHGETPDVEIYECGRPGLPRAVVYRDSMAISLIPLLAENFSRVVFVTSRRLDPAQIAREKPDIVIEEFVERSLNAPGALPMILG
jgi:alginate O-acetyltransferase complex protein AlgJ